MPGIAHIFKINYQPCWFHQRTDVHNQQMKQIYVNKQTEILNYMQKSKTSWLPGENKQMQTWPWG